MDELPVAIQQKLRRMPGAETGEQVVEVILEDGRIVPDVTVRECAYAEDDSFDAQDVADVRPAVSPPTTRGALVFILIVLIGLVVMFWLLQSFEPT